MQKKIFKKEIKNIKEEDIIDTLYIGKFYDFIKFNIKYSWEDENYLTEFTKKISDKYIYLVCKRAAIKAKNARAKQNTINQKVL